MSANVAEGVIVGSTGVVGTEVGGGWVLVRVLVGSCGSGGSSVAVREGVMDGLTGINGRYSV